MSAVSDLNFPKARKFALEYRFTGIQGMISFEIGRVQPLIGDRGKFADEIFTLYVTV